MHCNAVNFGTHHLWEHVMECDSKNQRRIVNNTTNESANTPKLPTRQLCLKSHPTTHPDDALPNFHRQSTQYHLGIIAHAKDCTTHAPQLHRACHSSKYECQPVTYHVADLGRRSSRISGVKCDAPNPPPHMGSMECDGINRPLQSCVQWSHGAKIWSLSCAQQ